VCVCLLCLRRTIEDSSHASAELEELTKAKASIAKLEMEKGKLLVSDLSRSE